jgi:tRNA threonylcarbamoyladenosine biosynthesis protein TsaB
MFTLAVDTSTRNGSLAVLRDGLVLGFSAQNGDAAYSTRFCSDGDELLARHGIRLAEIDLFAVASGPGSFTGVRIGLTAVKAWSEVSGKPIVSVSTLAGIAAQAGEDVAHDGLVAAVLDARRGQMFGGVYRRGEKAEDLALIGEETVSSPAEFAQLLAEQSNGSPIVFASPTPEVIESVIAESRFRGSPVRTVSSVLAPWIGIVGYRRARQGGIVDSLVLDANYVRRTDAEMKWKDS